MVNKKISMFFVNNCLVLFLLINLIADVANNQSSNDVPKLRINRDAKQGGGNAVFILIGVTLVFVLAIAVMVCYFIGKAKSEDEKEETVKTVEAKPTRKTMTKKK
ncbi:hypothetical protein ACQ4LE_001079 [Meloidogyne hapla]